MNIASKRDTAAEILNRQISKPPVENFYSSRLCIAFSNWLTVHRCDRDKLLPRVTGMFIYKFTCWCWPGYTDCTNRWISEFASENCPVWLLKVEGKANTISITEHLINSEHTASKTSSFKIIHTVEKIGSKVGQMKTLCTGGASVIHQFKPEFCMQKRCIQSSIIPRSWFT